VEFRWAVLIALWTMFSGPVIGPPVAPTPRHEAAAPTAGTEHHPPTEQPRR
jgi:hypothetical protein